MLRESLEKLSIELSPWTISEIRNKNVSRIRTLLYQIYIALKPCYSTYCSPRLSSIPEILWPLNCMTLKIITPVIVNIVKKHQKQRDAPFNGPIVYSTIESIRSEIRGRIFLQTDIF